MQRKQAIKTQEERIQESESCWSPRGYKKTRSSQCVASEHVTVSLSVAVENASSGQVGPTLLM